MADPEQPVFVLGGLSVKAQGWRETTRQFNLALDEFFGGARPEGVELHASQLICGDGAFANFDQEQRNALAHRYLDIISDRGHSIHFIGVDKARLALAIADADGSFFEMDVPYLLGFNYLVSYIEKYTKDCLGHTARGMLILDAMDCHQAQIDEITHFRRFEVANARKLKWLVEFSYPVDSARHPMVQASDLVIIPC